MRRIGSALLLLVPLWTAAAGAALGTGLPPVWLVFSIRGAPLELRPLNFPWFHVALVFPGVRALTMLDLGR